MTKASHIRDELERRLALNDAKEKVRAANANTHALKMETRLLQDQEARNKYKKELVHYKETVSQLSADVTNLWNEGDRQQIFLGAKTGTATPVVGPEATGDMVLDEVERVQDKTQASLSRTRQIIEDTKEIGMNTAEEVKRQGLQIESITNDVDKVEGNLHRADKLIRKFGRRMARDKLIQSFACINILLIVGLIIYAVLKSAGQSNESTAAVPESPISNGNKMAFPQHRYLRGTIS